MDKLGGRSLEGANNTPSRGKHNLVIRPNVFLNPFIRGSLPRSRRQRKRNSICRNARARRHRQRTMLQFVSSNPSITPGGTTAVLVPSSGMCGPMGHLPNPDTLTQCVLLPMQLTQDQGPSLATTDDSSNTTASRLTSGFAHQKSSTTAHPESSNSSSCKASSKRRISFSGYIIPKQQSAGVSRRNERERNRVKQVNLGFEKLRQHVPSGQKNKKMSKVDTLRGAVEYIKQLQEILDQTERREADFLDDVIKGIKTDETEVATPSSSQQRSRSGSASDNSLASPGSSYDSPTSYSSGSLEQAQESPESTDQDIQPSMLFPGGDFNLMDLTSWLEQ